MYFYRSVTGKLRSLAQDAVLDKKQNHLIAKESKETISI